MARLLLLLWVGSTAALLGGKQRRRPPNPSLACSRSLPRSRSSANTRLPPLSGWFDELWPQPSEQEQGGRNLKPEQYPANTQDAAPPLPSDVSDATVSIVRPLLKDTQLEARPLQVVFDTRRGDEWTARAFHEAVDGRGAAVVVGATTSGQTVGGYNPKGWASLGGARPSVAAFIFASPAGRAPGPSDKVPKVGGGGLACANDEVGDE